MWFADQLHQLMAASGWDFGGWLSGYLDICLPFFCPGGGGGGGGGTCVTGEYCPASSFTAIAAAFATQGYWVQADVLYYLNFTGLSYWATLVYILAAAGGLMGVALGAPPKMYLWFFMGPAIYSWLVGTTQEVKGVRWMVGNIQQDQGEVWRLAEPGLINTNLYNRRKKDGDPLVVSSYSEPEGTVKVATLFLWYDELISDTVQFFVRWTGMYSINSADSSYSNLPSGTTGIKDTARWYLLSNLKWGILENITSARLNNADLRDAFLHFMSSECGDILATSVDKGALVAAAHSKGERLGQFIADGTANGKMLSSFIDGAPYETLTNRMQTTVLPTPESMVYFLEEPSITRSAESTGAGAFRKFNSWLTDGAGSEPGYKNLKGWESRMSCAQMFWVLMHGFRWESGHTYYQVINSLPKGLSASEFVQTLFYGWNIRNSSSGEAADLDAYQSYLSGLILVYMIRNELMTAPRLVNVRYSSTEELENNSEVYQRFQGSKGKYAELYSWALMVPYLQGILMYFLATAFPFACIMVIMPGMHKTVFTWMSFWAWVKLWDVGFAFVVTIERSVWAMLGNSSDSAMVNYLVQGVARVNPVKTSCPPGIEVPAWFTGRDLTQGGWCPVPVLDGTSSLGTTLQGMQPWVYSLFTFDRALLLSQNMDLDLTNGYYIFIMSALYMAVPAVVGQLVLGAKAGMGNIATNMLSGVAGDSSKQAMSGVTAGLQDRLLQSQAAIGQEGAAKDMRQRGLAARAMEAQNRELGYGLAAGAKEQVMSGLGSIKDQLSNSQNSFEKANSAARFGLQLTPAGMRQVNGLANRINQGASADGSAAVTAATAGGIVSGAGPRRDGEQEAAGQEGRGQESRGAEAGDGAGSPGSRTPPPENLPPASGATNSAASASGAGTAAGAAAKSNATGAATSAAAGKAAGTGGGGGGGEVSTFGPKPFPGPRTGIGGIAQGVADGIGTTAAWAEASSNSGSYNNVLGEFSNMNTAISGMRIGQFEDSSAAKGYGAYGGRVGAQSNFNADMGSYRARRDFGNQVGTWASAAGIFAGTFSPGQKPTDMTGMAMNGQLNTYDGAGQTVSDAKGAGNFANMWDSSSGYASRLNAYGSEIRSQVGPGRVQGAYQETSQMQAAAYTYSNAPVAAVNAMGNVAANGSEAFTPRSGATVWQEANQGGTPVRSVSSEVGGFPNRNNQPTFVGGADATLGRLNEINQQGK